jgi:hypothetical protein
MIMPWGGCCLESGGCVCVIAKRRVVYNCVCVEVKESSQQATRMLDKNREKGRKNRNQMRGDEVMPLRGLALPFVLVGCGYGEHGAGRHARLLLSSQRDELRAGRLGNWKHGLLRTQEGRRREGWALGWQPRQQVLRGWVIRTGAQKGGPGRHG